MSMRPRRRATSPTSLSTAAPSVMSQANAAALIWKLEDSSRATPSACSRLCAYMTATCAPSFASAWQIRCPSPPLPPVTNATAPLSSMKFLPVSQDDQAVGVRCPPHRDAGFDSGTKRRHDLFAKAAHREQVLLMVHAAEAGLAQQVPYARVAQHRDLLAHPRRRAEQRAGGENELESFGVADSGIGPGVQHDGV